MAIRQLPEVQAFERPEGLRWDAPAKALDMWSGVQAAESTDPNTISIYDVIGEDPWSGGGFSAKRAAAALRSIGNNPITVSINSPGGDFFDGLAIYNLLREHPAEVTVKVVGIAASAASIIAMAGDKVVMGRGSFLMIHNAWSVAVGNRHDLRAFADTLEPFDAAMADIYAARTGKAVKAMAEMMDAESYIGAEEALSLGFADSLSSEEPKAAPSASIPENILARRRIEAAMAKVGIQRRERAALLENAGIAPRDASGPSVERDADQSEVVAALRSLVQSLKN